MRTLSKTASYKTTFADAEIREYSNGQIYGKRGRVVIRIEECLIYVSFIRLKNIETNNYVTYTMDEQEWEVQLNYSDNPNTDSIHFMKEKDLKKFILMVQYKDHFDYTRN